MSSSPIGQSSSPEQDSQTVDDRKRKRMQSNRESARRSRMKKQHRLEILIGEISRFKAENTELKATINLQSRQYMMVEKENNILQAKHDELALRLQTANSILRIYQEFTSFPLDIPSMPEPVPPMKTLPFHGMDPVLMGFEHDYPLFADPFMKSWHVTNVQPVMAASNLVPF